MEYLAVALLEAHRLIQPVLDWAATLYETLVSVHPILVTADPKDC